MPSPTTSILDAFNRADENPLDNGTWAGPVSPAHVQLQLLSDQAKSSAAATIGSSYWLTSFGTNQEAYAACDGVNNQDAWAFLRVSNPGTGTRGNFSAQYHIGTNQMNIYETVSGVATTLVNAAAPSNGRNLNTITNYWMIVTGTTLPVITCYGIFTGNPGIYEQVASFTYTSTVDASLQSGGFIGIGCYDNGLNFLDSFGGGTIPPASTTGFLRLSGVGT